MEARLFARLPFNHILIIIAKYIYASKDLQYE